MFLGSYLNDNAHPPMSDPFPTIELLEAMHLFPCQYTFKVIGRPKDHFIGRVLGAVRLELEGDAEPEFSSRESSKGKHVAVTIEPMVTSASQVLDIYKRLHELEGVLMLM